MSVAFLITSFIVGFSHPFFSQLNQKKAVIQLENQCSVDCRAPPGCRQGEPTHVEVRSLWRHREAGGLGGILTTAYEGGTVGEPVCVVVLKRLPVAVHGALEEMKRGQVHTQIHHSDIKTNQRERETIHTIKIICTWFNLVSCH